MDWQISAVHGRDRGTSGALYALPDLMLAFAVTRVIVILQMADRGIRRADAGAINAGGRPANAVCRENETRALPTVNRSDWKPLAII